MAGKDSLNNVLSHVPLFSLCNAKELKSIARLTTGLRLAAGTVVARQGAIGHHFAVITEGTVSVTIDGIAIAALGPGTSSVRSRSSMAAPKRQPSRPRLTSPSKSSATPNSPSSCSRRRR